MWLQTIVQKGLNLLQTEGFTAHNSAEISPTKGPWWKKAPVHEYLMERVTSIKRSFKPIYIHLETAHGEKSTLWAMVEGKRNRAWHEEFSIDKMSSEQYLY